MLTITADSHKFNILCSDGHQQQTRHEDWSSQILQNATMGWGSFKLSSFVGGKVLRWHYEKFPDVKIRRLLKWRLFAAGQNKCSPGGTVAVEGTTFELLLIILQRAECSARVLQIGQGFVLVLGCQRANRVVLGERTCFAFILRHFTRDDMRSRDSERADGSNSRGSITLLRCSKYEYVCQIPNHHFH